MTDSDPQFYRQPPECPNCGRWRVQGPGSGPDQDGVCEKCSWDIDGDNYASITRPGAQCIVCRSDNVDPVTGECDDHHWHRLQEKCSLP